MTQAEPRQHWGWYWGIAFLLLISPTTVALSESVFVLAPVDQSLINASRLWNVPMAEVLPIDGYYWSRWVFSLAAALVISVLVVLVRDRFESVITVCLLAGLSLSFQPRELSGLVGMVAWAALNRHGETQNSMRIARGSMILLFAGLTSLELGVFVVVMMTILWQSQRQTPITKKAVVVGLLAVLLAAIVLGIPSFGAMLLRPWNWIWLDRASICIPELQPVLSGDRLQAGLILLLPVICDALRRIWMSPDCVWTTRFVALLLATLGCLCQWYTPLATVALISLVPRRLPLTNPQTSWFIPVVGGGLALVQLSVTIIDEGLTRLSGGAGPGIVDVTHWPGQGPVFLTNLSQSHHWQSPELRKRFPLLLSDRWDIGAEIINSYAVTCRDLTAGKREPYWKSDGTWGGFLPFLLDHDVAVIVIDSHNLDAIRKTSLDPQWRILSIDARRTTFGRFDRASTGPQTERAGRLLLHLEWPRPVLADTLDGSLELGSPDELRKVAMVLNAIRLPYAALKLLPTDTAWETERVATWSHVELAQRALRQAGTASLVDHPRALRGLQNLSRSWWISSSNRELVRRSYSALTSATNSAKIAEASPAESEFRTAMLTGDWQGAEAAVASMPATLQQYFRVFLVPSTAGDQADALRNVLSDELPLHLQAEGWFLLAGLQLELGETDAARESLAQGSHVDQETPYASLRAFYAAQMR